MDELSTNRIFNGSFEKGGKGWFIFDDISSNKGDAGPSHQLYQGLQIAGGSTGSSGVYEFKDLFVSGYDEQFDFKYAPPTDGDHNFWTSWDGAGPGVITLSQDVSLAESKTDILHFDYSAAWNLNDFIKHGADHVGTDGKFKVQSRHFQVEVRDLTTGEIKDFDLLTAKGFTVQGGGGSHHVTLDLSEFAGDDITLQFRWLVPQDYTGPASFSLDDVQLNANEQDGTSAGEVLRGSFYNDHLIGNGGADTLLGARGADVLEGGKGADVFLYTNVHQSYESETARPARGGIDTIVDMQMHDLVDVSAIDADKHADGDQAFVWVASFDGHKGEATLSYDAKTGQTTLALDVNGDMTADMTIRIDGDHTAHLDGFVL